MCEKIGIVKIWDSSCAGTVHEQNDLFCRNSCGIDLFITVCTPTINLFSTSNMKWFFFKIY